MAGIGGRPGDRRGIGHVLGQRPAWPGGLDEFDRRPQLRLRHHDPMGDLTGRYVEISSRTEKPCWRPSEIDL